MVMRSQASARVPYDDGVSQGHRLRAIEPCKAIIAAHLHRLTSVSKNVVGIGLDHGLFFQQRTMRKFDRKNMTYFVIHIYTSPFGADLCTSHHYHVEDASLLQVFDQPLHGLLESAFLGSLYRRLALYRRA
jgi:hypothetical protein